MKAVSSAFRSTALLAALCSHAAGAPAANSAEATAAAQRHLAEKRGTAAASTARNVPAGDWSAQLAACQARAGGNLVGREKCVWSHCNGHWGEGACPPGSDWPPKFKMKKFEKFGSHSGADAR